MIAGQKRQTPNFSKSSSSSASSQISSKAMELILEKLKCNHNRESTKKNYQGIWRKFNCFIIQLDKKPESWEERVALFLAYLVEHGGIQSSTLRSYTSAIKSVLLDDGYEWNDQKLLMGTLSKSCKLINDRVRTRLPIKKRSIGDFAF